MKISVSNYNIQEQPMKSSRELVSTKKLFILGEFTGRSVRLTFTEIMLFTKMSILVMKLSSIFYT